MPYLFINDLDIYYESHGQGPPLLFIHGLGSSIQDWEHQIAAFSKQYQVIVFDLRGHGKSEKTSQPYTVQQFAKDTALLIRLLVPTGVHVIGHSLGGMIAFQLALDFPNAVKSLMIINSAPAVSFPSFKEHLLFSLRKWIIQLFGIHFFSGRLAQTLFPKPEQAHMRGIFVQRWSQNNKEAYLNALNAFSDWSVVGRLTELQCPTAIITADQDYTPVAYKQAYCQQIQNAELVVIQDSRHMSIIDQYEAVNSALFQFLSKNA